MQNLNGFVNVLEKKNKKKRFDSLSNVSLVAPIVVEL